MRILLLGKSGQLGWELQRSLAPLGQVIAPGRDDVQAGGDLTQLDALAAAVRGYAPQLIVNAAAYTAVDKAQSQPELARRVNALAPGVLACEAERLGAWLVHYSSDYVFDGSGDRPWRESDTPSPVNVYGQTKLEGERAVQAGCSRHLIWRTSWVYAARGANFARTMLRLAAEREELRVVKDQMGAPTGADLLADLTALALQQVGRCADLSGLYHVSASGQTSWHGYACHVIEQARRLRPDRALRVRRIEAVPSSEFASPAQRPLNSRLDNARFCAAFGLSLPPWQQGVDRMLAEILEARP